MTHEEAMQDDFGVPNHVKLDGQPSSTPQSVDKEAILSKFKTFSNYYNQEGYETEDVITAMDEYAAENEELIIEMRKEYDQAVDKINQLKSSNKAKEKEIERLKGLIETLHTEAFGINPVKWLQFKAENNL